MLIYFMLLIKNIYFLQKIKKKKTFNNSTNTDLNLPIELFVTSLFIMFCVH